MQIGEAPKFRGAALFQQALRKRFLITKIFPDHAKGIVDAMENLTRSEQKQLGMLRKKLAKAGREGVKRSMAQMDKH
jgi:hypothetical protein